MNKPKLSFPVMSDVHITADWIESHQKLEQALKDVGEIAPDYDALILNGDMTENGRVESYEKLEEIISENVQKDTFYAMGNHEFFKNDGNEAAINRYLDFIGGESVFFEEDIKGYPFIFLGSESWGPLDSPTKDSAVLSSAQLTWLEKTLAKHAVSKKPIFVFLHHPIPFTITGTEIPYYQKGIIQSKELVEILSNYPQVVYFSGHSHWDLRQPGMFLQKPFAMVNTGSVYNTWGPDGQGHETVVDGQGSQGLFIEVYEDKVSIRGRDFAKQQWIEEYTHIIPIDKPVDS